RLAPLAAPAPLAMQSRRRASARPKQTRIRQRVCGIAGFTGPDVMPEQAMPLLDRMIRTLAHRGPDGFGFHAEPGVGLAHARLSIIDLSTGAQPIHNPRRN